MQASMWFLTTCFLYPYKHSGRHCLYVNEANTHSCCYPFAWGLLYNSFISCPKEYLEATEPRMEAFPSPLSTSISPSSSRVENWKYSDFHWASHRWEHAHSASMSVLVTAPLSLRLRRAPNEKRSGLEILWQLIFLTKTATKTENDTELISSSDNFKAVMRTDNCRKCFPLLLKLKLCFPAVEHWWQARRKTILVPKPPLAEALHEEATGVASLCIASSTGLVLR